MLQGRNYAAVEVTATGQANYCTNTRGHWTTCVINNGEWNIWSGRHVFRWLPVLFVSGQTMSSIAILISKFHWNNTLSTRNGHYVIGYMELPVTSWSSAHLDKLS